jgi:indolepyruvate ferredoxin oxidoreductase
LLTQLNADNYPSAVAIAQLPEQIRGYGHVKARAIEQARVRAQLLKKRMAGTEPPLVQLFEPAA